MNIESPLEISSILILDESTRESQTAAESIGARLISDVQAIAPGRFDLLITTAQHLPKISQYRASFVNRRLLVIGAINEANSRMVFDLMQKMSIFAWVSSYSDPEFTLFVRQALDQAIAIRQATESLAMYLEHNESLQRLSQELEQRIELRRSELNDSTWRMQTSQRRSEIMHRTLNAVHMSQSIPEIERQLLQILGTQTHSALDAPTIDWVRITFPAQSRLEAAPLDARAGSIFSAPLGADAHIHFGRASDRPFRSDDRSFLNSITEAVALAVTRLSSLQRMERVKQEWEETFDAITHPIAVFDENLKLVRGNRALLRGRAPEQVVGRPCYEAVFNRTEACTGCATMADLLAGRLFKRTRGNAIGLPGTNVFRIETQKVEGTSVLSGLSEVSSRPLNLLDEVMIVHLYRDATSSVQFEKRIVESSKMAELGTIGSSIAHQLNNPLGGMLSHIQLLRMDLKSLNFSGKDELESELAEMENGTRRCAEIVRDLLGFSRRADEDEAHDHDLIEIVTQAIKITELQTRSRGIRFKMESVANEVQISGRFNLLAQSVRAVLLTLLPKSLRDTTIHVNLKISERESRPVAEITIGPVPGFGPLDSAVSTGGELDLTVAQQILSEHGGSLTGPAIVPTSLAVSVESKFPPNQAILTLPIKTWT